MVLYYALGGGLGHITRAQQVLSALGLSDEAVLLSASPHAKDVRVTGKLPLIDVPRGLGHDRRAFASWLAGTVEELEPEELIVDSFPGGILGELCGLALPPARYVARRLRWSAYTRRLPGALPKFELAHVLEPLERRHELALERSARLVQELTLPAAPALAGGALIDAAHVLVVHSGPQDEVIELAEYAAEIRASATTPVLVISPRRPARLPSGCEWRDLYPAAPHFPHAELVVTAAGFNAVREAAGLRDRHRVMPFPRALDDQFWRAAAAARGGRVRATVG